MHFLPSGFIDCTEMNTKSWCNCFFIAARERLDDTTLNSGLPVLGCKNGGNNCLKPLRLAGKFNYRSSHFMKLDPCILCETCISKVVEANGLIGGGCGVCV